MHLLELKNIHKSYRRGGLFGLRDRFQVLKDVNLTIKPGSCLGLLGRSGSGKSTLGRIVLGLEKPDSGQILYQGKNPRDMTKTEYREYRKNLQVVFQNSLGSVNPRLNAGQIIAEPLQNFQSPSKGQVEQKVAELLTRVGLNPRDAKKYPHQFSGGELQRICIARAISLNPRLIVLDEAVSSLDMLIQAVIMELLIKLQKETGAAYLFISHDIRVLLKLSDMMAIIHHGQIVEQVDHLNQLQHVSHPAFTQLINAVLPPLPAS